MNSLHLFEGMFFAHIRTTIQMAISPTLRKGFIRIHRSKSDKVGSLLMACRSCRRRAQGKLSSIGTVNSCKSKLSSSHSLSLTGNGQNWSSPHVQQALWLVRLGMLRVHCQSEIPFDIIQKSSQGGLPSAYSVVDVGTVIMRQRTESLQCRFMALWEPATEHTQSKIKNQWFRLEIWWNPPQFHDEVMMKSYEIVMFAITADPIWPPPRCSWALDFRAWKLGSHKRCVVPAFAGTQVLCTLFLGRKPYWDEDFIVPKVVPWMVKLTGQEPFSLDKRHNICNVYRYYNVIYIYTYLYIYIYIDISSYK